MNIHSIYTIGMIITAIIWIIIWIGITFYNWNNPEYESVDALFYLLIGIITFGPLWPAIIVLSIFFGLSFVLDKVRNIKP